jgi:hypothetical protein
VTGFHAAAALFALVVLVRNAGRALKLLAPRSAAADRLAGLAPLLASLAALAVLWVAVKGLLAPLMNTTGGSP